MATRQSEGGGGGGGRTKEEGSSPSSYLELCEADLQIPGSFDDAVKGCQYVFHVASPVVYE